MRFTLFFLLIISTCPTRVFAAANGLGVFTGTQTTAPSNPDDWNQSQYSVKWSSSDYDASYFEHSVSSVSHEITVKADGDYLLRYHAPFLLTNSSNNRRSIRTLVFVNGVQVETGHNESTYLRQQDGHNESSAHLGLLLPNLNENDVISLRVDGRVISGAVTVSKATLMLEYVNPGRTLFVATATQTNAPSTPTDLNQSTAYALEWTEIKKDSEFTHSNSTNPESITLTEAGDYLVMFNLPLEIGAACSGNNDRRSVQGLVQLDGSTVTGGIASQGYIRCLEGHQSSSVHWFGLLTGVTANQVLSIKTLAETTNLGSVTLPSGSKASLYVEKVDTSSDMISLRGSALTSGNDWNPSNQDPILWSTETFKDATVFTHSTSTNADKITINADGDYLITYTDAITSTVQRQASQVAVEINSVPVTGGTCNSHYTRNLDGHAEASCSMVLPLSGLRNGDVLSLSVKANAQTGTANDLGDARLTVVKLVSQPYVFSIQDIEEMVVHLDGQTLTSIKDSSNRDPNDPSFSGSVNTWADLSGSSNVHDFSQGSSTLQPTYDKPNNFVIFDGSNDYLTTPNHTDINLASVYDQRTIVMAFRTGSDVTSRQILYEEGGNVRGMNVFIRAGNLHLGFWNATNDGDGAQAFTSASTSVAADTHYYVVLVYDYSNYTGPSGANGQLRGYINGSAFPSIGTTTSRLYAHSGKIAIGAMINGSYYDDGLQNGDGAYFQGDIFEFILYNSAADDVDAGFLHTYLTQRWPDPQPPTALTLASQYTSSSSSSPLVGWTASVTPDVDHYEIALGTTQGGVDTVAFFDIGNVTSYTFNSLSLSECTNYYVSVRAQDVDTNDSTVLEGTQFIRYDGTNPTDPSALSLSGTATPTQSKQLSWSASTDACSFSHYELAIGTTSGGQEAVAWTNVGGVTSYQFTGISPSLSGSTNYFTSIRAVDRAGNTSNVVTSSAWQTETCVASDVTSPTDPGSVSLSGSGSSVTSPTLSWSGSSDACSFSHYEVAVGTSSGGQEAIAWTNVGNVLSHKFYSISPTLSTSTNYYTSVRAVDSAGNSSGSVTSSAWQLPAPGGVTGNLELWLDAQDSSTLFQLNTCTSAVTADGQSVGCWQDKSGNANHATATGGNRPTYQTNELNGQAVIRLDGSNDALDFTAISNIRTVFAVNRSATTSYQPLLGHSTSTHFFTTDNTLLDTTNSSPNLQSGSWRVDRSDVASPTVFSQTQAYSLISVVSGGNVEADHISSDRKTGGRFFNGDWVELIIYSRALNASEVTSVENYLYDKWFMLEPSPPESLVLSSSYTTTSSQSPSFSWSESPSTDLDHYEVAMGSTPGGNEISGWTSVGLSTSYQFTSLSLSECQDTYLSVRAVDTDSYVSSTLTSTVVRFDSSLPSTPTSLVLSGTASPSQAKTLSWAASTDNCSFSHYEIAVGTTSGGSDASTWADVGNVNSFQITSISPSLSYATNYYTSLRAVDSAGNISSVSTTAAWQLDSCVASDVTAPSDPSNLTLTGIASKSSSPTLSWTPSTDSCSFSHMFYAVGTTSGGQDVVAWTNIGSPSSYQSSGLSPNLQLGQAYYTSLKGVDSAGNESNVVTSSAWQLPTPGSVSSNLVLWWDVNDSSTLFQDGACTTSVSSNGQALGCILDKSNSGNNGSVSTTANKPTYRTSGFGGKVNLDFDGAADEYLEFNSTISTIRTVFWVLKEDASNPGNTAFLLGDPSGSTYDFFRGATLGSIFSAANASSSVTGGTLQLDKNGITGTSTNMPSQKSVMSLVTTGNVTASAFSRDRTSCCGERTWGGRLGELIIYDRALNSTEVGQVEDYLMNKWGIAATETTWLGGVSDVWTNGSNWSDGVPTTSQKCIIPAGSSYQPVVTTGTIQCKDVEITATGNLTLQSGGSVVFEVYGDFDNYGTFTANDNTLRLRDDGVNPSDQTLSLSTVEVLSFNKTAGGSAQFKNSVSAATVNSFSIGSSQNFEFIVKNNQTITFPNGLSLNSGTFKVESGGTIEIGSGQTLAVNGGVFKTTGINDAYPQNLSNKAKLTRSGGGRWSFAASAGSLSLVGFLIEYLDSDGLQVSGNATLQNLDGGQFVYLNKDYSSPVKAIQFNTTTALSEAIATNVGFNWGAANSTYGADPVPTDNYILVNAPACGSSALIFDQWFGDFWGANPNPDTESKIIDQDDGGSSCQISMDASSSPVTLNHLTAYGYDSAVLVSWSTSVEMDHLGFNVYRSTDPNTGYFQINPEMIRNFLDSANFRGDYEFLDEGVSNGTAYFYMVEDISINGESTWHGPVTASADGSAGAAPSPESENNSVEPPSVPLVSSGLTILAQTGNQIKIEIQVPPLQFIQATWDTSYDTLEMSGYSKSTQEGHPELLNKVFLVPIEKGSTEVSVVNETITVAVNPSFLNGHKISPAPSWIANGAGILEPQFNPLSEAYTSSLELPNSYFELNSSIRTIGGRDFIEIKVNPVRYQASTQVLHKLDRLVLDLALDSGGWQATQAGGPTDTPAYSDGTLRMKYSKPGLYEVRYSDLFDAYVEGPFEGADTSQLRLFYHDQEVPIEILGPPSFANGSKIRFYAPFETSSEDSFDEVVLTLKPFAQSPEAPRRIVALDDSLTQSFDREYLEGRNTVTVEQNWLPVFDRPMGGVEEDRFYWVRKWRLKGAASDANSKHVISVDLPGLNNTSAQSVRVEVQVRGRSVFARNPQHHLSIRVNGFPTDLEDEVFDRDAPYTVSFDLLSHFFNEGNNTLTLEVLGDLVPDGDYDLIDFNSVKISYPIDTRVIDDQLDIQEALPHTRYTLGGLSSSNILVYDLSHPDESYRYEDLQIDSFDGSDWWVRFTSVQGNLGLSGKELHILEASKLLKPEKFLLGYTPQLSLRAPTQKADLLIVGTPSMLAATDRLAERRRQQGLSVQQVSLEQIYAEFAHGRRRSRALRDFIQYSLENWATPPRYLLILGDSTYDPQDYLGVGIPENATPLPVEKGLHVDFGNDNYFVSSPDSVAPQVAVGRLPTTSPDTVARYVEKLIAYEDGLRAPQRTTDAVFIAGEDYMGEGFATQNQTLADTLHFSNDRFSSVHINRESYSSDISTNLAVMDQFENPPLTLSFYGHGAESLWGSAQLFGLSHAKSLENERLPIVMAFDCLNSYFYDIDPSVESLGEALVLNEKGGAIAFWGSTTFTAPNIQINLAKSFYSELGQAAMDSTRSMRLGDIILKAKVGQSTSLPTQDTIKSYTLFGDPSMPLPDSTYSSATSQNSSQTSGSGSSSGSGSESNGIVGCGMVTTGSGGGGPGSGPGPFTALFGLLFLMRWVGRFRFRLSN